MRAELYNPDLDVFEEAQSVQAPTTASKEESLHALDLDTITNDALIYILNELRYLRSVFDVDDIHYELTYPNLSQCKIDSCMADGITSSAEMNAYFQKMQRLKADHNFVIGGQDGIFTTMSHHTYDPAIHRPLLRRGGDPSKITSVLTGIPEVGKYQEDTYIRLVQPFFILPNQRDPGSEYSEMIDFLLKFGSPRIQNITIHH